MYSRREGGPRRAIATAQRKSDDKKGCEGRYKIAVTYCVGRFDLTCYSEFSFLPVLISLFLIHVTINLTVSKDAFIV